MSDCGPAKRIRLDSSASESADSSDDSSSTLEENATSSQGHSTDTEDSEEENVEEPQRKEIEDPLLHKAIEAHDLNLITKILNSGVDIDAIDRFNYTALHRAIRDKYLAGIKCLLEYGASISTTGEPGHPYFYDETPLHFAVTEDRLDIVEALFATPVDASKLMKNYDKLFTYALKRKNYRNLKCLLGFSTEDDDLKKKAFDMFPKQQLRSMGYEETFIDSLYEKFFLMNSVNKWGETPLLLAIRRRNLNIIEYLLANGADINTSSYCHHHYHWTALHEAIDVNDEEIVEFLLKRNCELNCEPTKYHPTPLEVAVSKNNLKIVQKLVDKITEHEHEKDKFKYVLKAFHEAVQKNFQEIAKYFLTTVKIDVDMTTEEGYTALGLAVAAGQVDMAELLLDFGSDIHLYSEGKGQRLSIPEPPIYRAVRYGNLMMFDLLLSRGARINEEMTPMYLAISSDNHEMVRRILDLGVDVYCKREFHYPYHNMTPLLLAAYEKSKEMFLMLLENGANINDMAKEDGANKSVIDIALKENCSNDFLIMLLNSGADANAASFNNRRLPEGKLYILKRHLLKLKAAKLFVDHKYDAWIDDITQKRFYNKCRREVKKMKEKFPQLPICYHDLLIKDDNRVAIYAKNKTIEDALEMDKLKIKFPLYTEMLICQFKRGKRRNHLLKNTSEMYEDIFISLPYDCVIQILMYLSNEDLLRSLGKLFDVET